MAVTTLTKGIKHRCKENEMTNNILLLTHGQVGQALLDAAENTLGFAQNNLSTISVDNSLDYELLHQNINSFISMQLKETNLLIMTDLLGSTPCNIASQLISKNNVAVITGVNLGMVLRSINYINRPFSELVQKASEGGKNCITICGTQQE